MIKNHRFSLVEYGKPNSLVQQIKASTGLPELQVLKLLIDADLRISKQLKVTNNSLVISTSGVSAKAFAGIIRLSPTIELEIAPKFLGLNDTHSEWKEDFFFLLTLSRYGSLLPRENLRSSTSAHRDLANLVARSFIQMYESRKRRPIRNYQKFTFESFEYEGDPDPMDLINPSPDGFVQSVFRFDKRNQWNFNILTAAKILSNEVTEAELKGGLLRIVSELSPQFKKSLNLRNRVIPSRSKDWETLYELSINIQNGFGINYLQGTLAAPGFVIQTWRVWEDLISIALHMAFGSKNIQRQPSSRLGCRIKSDSMKKELSVEPDYLIFDDTENVSFIVDAKYKGHIDKGGDRIAETDIYESLAFSRAVGCKRVALIYPAIYTEEKKSVGCCSIFEEIQVEDINIYGISIEVRGIAKRGGLKEFAKELRKYLIEVGRCHSHKQKSSTL
ncbi:hypothetical protein ABH307_14160 [Acinetobacter pittii]|uniref:5-methylcytosine restriction system specificity protein McrC n=1 Tax=Acinetobacter pittii TaxID=48296 RepID=UPI000A3D4734|nr:hypothetical protein [Acinetobacter pittii]MCZ1179024.1 hypothetical protein [Acinetobacter pittii]OTU49785.1 hypothetical protein CAT36_14705 [Acinetobacter pittii]QDB84101.1 restriction endonuclease [Acinetobacter pittii]